MISRRLYFNRTRRAWTLVEVLLTIAILAVLMGLILPALSQSREAGRGSACSSGLHNAGLAVSMYLDDSNSTYWPYYQDIAGPGGGRRWWFGFEKTGPPSNAHQMNRPLDKTRGFLSRYLSKSNGDLMCPSFPYGQGKYFAKFSPPAGGYGYNSAGLGGSNLLNPLDAKPRRLDEFHGRTGDVFVLADGIHFDRLDYSSSPPLNQGFNEPAYIQWQAPDRFSGNGGVNGGYGHYRHGRRAVVLYLDGHVAGQPIRRPAHPYSSRGIGPIANLADDQLRVSQVRVGQRIYAVDLIYGLR